MDVAWVEPARRIALIGFPAMVVFCVLVPRLAGRVFWTVSIASLPLFFVIAGYHRWRRICPLAAVSQLPIKLGRPGSKRAGAWLQAHAYHVSFGVFLFSLWLRLVATNGDGYALATFLVAIAAAAFITGLLFTGKTWCNYICPIGFVEKVYTEPRNLRETVNSQCQKCTACKPACPDINEENSYWKEILASPKRDVYFSFPGVIFAFYFFYWVQAGAWSYYFGGSWTRQVGLVKTAFLPGHDPITAGAFFWPEIPRAITAALTLLAGGAVSFVLFRIVERSLRAQLAKRDPAPDDATVRHLMFTICAFTAFVTFYTFAGAPTIRLVPSLPHFFQILVVATATIFLIRRLLRRQGAFAEETLARRIVAQWPWSDVKAPKDLREAFLVHTIRSQSDEQARTRSLQLYKSAVRDTLTSGIVSRGEIHRLDALRGQMRISEADHERVMAELAEEERGVSKALIVSPEKHLQIETYAEALAVHLERQRIAGGAIDDAVIRELRREYGVTEQEHAAVVDRLLRDREGLAAHMLDAPADIEIALDTINRLAQDPTAAARFLTSLLQRRAGRVADGVVQTLGGDATGVNALRDALVSPDQSARSAAITTLSGRLSKDAAARMSEAYSRALETVKKIVDLPTSLRTHFTSPDPYIRAAAFYMFESLDEPTEADYAALSQAEHPIVSELIEVSKRLAAGRTIMAEPTTFAKMIGIKSVGIFDGLEPEDLAQIARAGTESWFRQGDVLCREGELGEEVFVLLTGEVTITRKDGVADHVVGVEGPGSVIGELAVLDPAPRQATVTASSTAVRTLRLAGAPFRKALYASPALSEVIIRKLAQRLRAQTPRR